MANRVIYQFMVPVHVEVRDGRVSHVIVLDDAPVNSPPFVDGDRDYLQSAVAASLNGQPWPVWEFGY